MSTPNRQPNRAPDEALDILRRLEPALSRLNDDIKKLDDRTQRIEAEQRRAGERLATLEGKVSQLPTLSAWCCGAASAQQGTDAAGR